jgi:uncharacterized protein (DUF433 family)
MTEYIEKIDGTYRIKGSRVSLDSIVYAFQRGASAESIQRSFPATTLETVYGAIAYYLANQDEIDNYLSEGDAAFAELKRSSRRSHAAWYDRLETIKHESPVS